MTDEELLEVVHRLEKHKVDISDAPFEALDILKDMTDSELELLGELQSKVVSDPTHKTSGARGVLRSYKSPGVGGLVF